MRSKSLITINDPTSFVSESYKMFRTNLSYMNIDKENQVLMFTSSTSEEGKTTTIANAAISFAQNNQKVLIIECDLRRARIHTLFNINQEPGLTNLLSEKKSFKQIVQSINELKGLDIITSGPLPPSPAEILGSTAIEGLIAEARKVYDIILIDAPPILHVTDAAILSRLVDGVILVVAANETKKEAIIQSKKALEKVTANILGVILTKVKVNKGSYYYSYYQGYYNSKKKKRKKGARDKKKSA